MITVFLAILVCLSRAYHIDYPVRFTYINRINTWWPAESVLAGLGVPGYAPDNLYNYLAFAFWTTNKGVADVAKVWEDPLRYLTNQT